MVTFTEIFKGPSTSYIPLSPFPLVEECETSQPSLNHSRRLFHERVQTFALILTVLVATCGGVALLDRTFSDAPSTSQTSPSPRRCLDPPKRREWRSLNSIEQREYINAVQCLRNIDSELFPGLSLYDEFPGTHITVGVSGRPLLLQFSSDAVQLSP